jgi:hypothetical protein
LYISKHSNDIRRLSHGSASQLRSSAVNLGSKKLYILDLARSKSKLDKKEDLLSVLGNTKIKTYSERNIWELKDINGNAITYYSSIEFFVKM